MGSPSSPTTKTLWIFDHYAVPPGVPGFVRQHDHARIIAQRGWTTRVFASAYNHKTHRFERSIPRFRISKDVNESGVDFTWLYTTPYIDNGWKRYFNMLSYMLNALINSSRGPRPDIVMGANPHLLAALAACLVAKRYRVPFVFEVQDLWPESLIGLGLTNRPILGALRWLERYLYRNADKVVSLSNGITRGVEKVGPIGTDISLIPNGAMPSKRLSTEDRTRERKTRGWDTKWIAMWAGAHAEANSLETILTAARTLEHSGDTLVHFVFVGDGPDKARLQTIAKDLNSVSFLDPVPQSDVGSLLQLADAGLIVYKDTEFVQGARPTKLSEYMSVGLPVINDIQGECAEILAEANGGLTVESANPERLAEAIRWASEHPSEFRQLGDNGWQFVETTLHREKIAHQLGEEFDRLIDKSGA